MNLGSLTTIGSQKPKNLIHVIFDNSIHESTGGQPTNSKNIKIQNLAKACNYQVFFAKTENKIKTIFQSLKHTTGPVMIVVQITKSDNISPRVEPTPIEIRNRFMMSLKR